VVYNLARNEDGQLGSGARRHDIEAVHAQQELIFVAYRIRVVSSAILATADNAPNVHGR
jgi:hypothetical protein